MTRANKLIDVCRYLPVAEKDACWLWLGKKHRQGYGQIKIKGKWKLAHRAVYELFVEPIPKGLKLLHKCDTPACVNPYHMFKGTQQDNIIDMFKKGRGRPGGYPCK